LVSVASVLIKFFQWWWWR